MGYYTVYKFDSTNTGLTLSNNKACFARLYSNGTEGTKKVVNYLFYKKKGNNNNFTDHNVKLTYDNIVKYFSYFNDVFSVPPIVTLITNREVMEEELGDELEDVIEYGFDISKIVKIEWDVKSKSKVYIKFVTNLVRYLYEATDSRGEAVKKFMKYRSYKRYANIPSIELFQLCHSNINVGSGHGLFQSRGSSHINNISRDTAIRPLKEAIIIDRLKKGTTTQINNVFTVSKFTMKNEFNFTKLIKDYNENYNNRK